MDNLVIHDDRVQLVTPEGETLGFASKLDAHRGEGMLHRAISVLLRNASGSVLLQRRARGKYHFGGRWANTCCSHPYGGETPSQAAARALDEEMGIECSVIEVGTFVYRAADPASDLSEWEYDHVFVGSHLGDVNPNPEEVAEARWFAPHEALALSEDPDRAAPWLAHVLRVAGVE